MMLVPLGNESRETLEGYERTMKVHQKERGKMN
jgi:hypothetical protein